MLSSFGLSPFMDRPKLDLSDPSCIFALPGSPCRLHGPSLSRPGMPWTLSEPFWALYGFPGLSLGIPGQACERNKMNAEGTPAGPLLLWASARKLYSLRSQCPSQMDEFLWQSWHVRRAVEHCMVRSTFELPQASITFLASVLDLLTRLHKFYPVFEGIASSQRNVRAVLLHFMIRL